MASVVRFNADSLFRRSLQADSTVDLREVGGRDAAEELDHPGNVAALRHPNEHEPEDQKTRIENDPSHATHQGVPGRDGPSPGVPGKRRELGGEPPCTGASRLDAEADHFLVPPSAD